MGFRIPNEFSTILIDPPWLERGAGKIKRGSDKHYKLLSVQDIILSILGSPLWLPAQNAHLYLWATTTHLMIAGNVVMPALGFKYTSGVTWEKDQPSIGQYFRGQTEYLLLGVRGRGYAVRTERRDLTTLLKAPVPRYPKGHPKVGRRIHSRKPPEAYERIEARSKGPYAELFARPPTRPGWFSWGQAEEGCEPEIWVGE